MDIIAKLECWEADIEKAEKFNLTFDAKVVKEMIKVIKVQQLENLFLRSVITGAEKVAEKIGDSYVLNYIWDKKRKLNKYFIK